MYIYIYRDIDINENINVYLYIYIFIYNMYIFIYLFIHVYSRQRAKAVARCLPSGLKEPRNVQRTCILFSKVPKGYQTCAKRVQKKGTKRSATQRRPQRARGGGSPKEPPVSKMMGGSATNN